MHVHVEFHHLVEIEGSGAPGDRHTHRVADEIPNMMVFHEFGYFEKIGLFSGVSMSFSMPASPSLRALLKRLNIIRRESMYCCFE